MAHPGPGTGPAAKAATVLRWMRAAPGTLARRLAGPRPAADRLLIFDDIFPCPQSSFRFAEFTAHLAAFPQAEVATTGTAARLLGPATTFPAALAAYAQRYSPCASRVHRYHGLDDWRGRAAYAVFLNNARNFLPAIARHRLPFAFTLYPGGGFALDQPPADEKLRRVCGSPLFRRVIVNQARSRDYLVQRGFCAPGQVEYIPGIVLPLNLLARAAPPKKLRGRDKDTFDICFVAFKYRPGGVDKGYDRFVAVAQALASRHADIRFHVVGPYGPDDADVAALGDRLRFHGVQPTDFFPAFHAGMDLMLMPGPAFVRAPGEFDGFPISACIEAALCGSAVFTTDPFRQNDRFRDGEELVIVPDDRDGIVDVIEEYYRDCDRLSALARAGQDACRERYGFEAQLAPRQRILAELLGVPPPQLDAAARAALP